MYWILGRKLELSKENKLLIYKTILKPIWTYPSGVQLVIKTLKYYRDIKIKYSEQ